MTLYINITQVEGLPNVNIFSIRVDILLFREAEPAF
jgi:hypothetical protein